MRVKSNRDGAGAGRPVHACDGAGHLEGVLGGVLPPRLLRRRGGRGGDALGGRGGAGVGGAGVLLLRRAPTHRIILFVEEEVENSSCLQTSSCMLYSESETAVVSHDYECDSDLIVINVKVR